METEDSSDDGQANAQDEPRNESDPLLDRPVSSDTAQSANKLLLIYAFPALLLWSVYPNAHPPSRIAR